MADSLYDGRYVQDNADANPRLVFTTHVHDQKTNYYQPNFIRHHHPYRGPMSSEDMNLELGLFRHDIATLYAIANQVSNKFETFMRVLEEGSSNTYQINWYYDMATPAVQSDQIDGLEDIMIKLDGFIKRLEVLENNL